MTIDKAIDILQDEVPYLEPNYGPDFITAIKIASEAMKVLRHGRLIGAHNDPVLLPGETKD